jgi:hypothetical protein
MPRFRRFLALIAAPLIALTLTALVAPAAFAADEKPGIAFGAPCAQVQIIVIPGSHETKELTKMDNAAKGVLVNVVSTLEERYQRKVRAHYIGYPAKIASIINIGSQKDPIVTVSWDYTQSRAKGYQATWMTLKYYRKQCPATKYILTGYSQGAHIAGDLTATISKENQPIPASSLISVRLLADPARTASFSRLVGMGTGGNGGVLGHRTFGSLNNRVTEYCVKGDAICDFTLRNLVNSAANGGGTHTQYDGTYVPGTQTTMTMRMKADIIADVLNARL